MFIYLSVCGFAAVAAAAIFHASAHFSCDRINFLFWKRKLLKRSAVISSHILSTLLSHEYLQFLNKHIFSVLYQIHLRHINTMGKVCKFCLCNPIEWIMRETMQLQFNHFKGQYADMQKQIKEMLHTNTTWWFKIFKCKQERCDQTMVLF